MINIEAFEKMIASGRDSALLRFGLGKAYMDRSDFSTAVTHFEKCVELDPNYSAGWKLLVKSRMALSDHAGALSALETGLAVAKNNRDTQAEKEMGVLLRRLNKATSD